VAEVIGHTTSFAGCRHCGLGIRYSSRLGAWVHRKTRLLGCANGYTRAAP
jgi:hypothetical protein